MEQATDAFITGVGVFGGQPNSLTIAGEEEAMLEPVYGQATSRFRLIVHADRLSMINFIRPWGKDGNPELEQGGLRLTTAARRTRCLG